MTTKISEMTEETSILASHQLELNAAGTSKCAQVGNLYKDAKLTTAVQEAAEIVVPVTAMGAGSVTALAASQTPAAAGNLTLDGTAISGGKWTSASASVIRKPTIVSGGDVSGVNFTITGKGSDGAAKVETKAGPNNGTTTFGGFIEVTGISCDTACGAAITSGFGGPLLYLEPGLCNNYRVAEGAAAWSVYSNPLSNLSSTMVSLGNLLVLKDATPRTITFASGVNMTAKVLGAAPEMGNAGKYVGYSFRAFRAVNSIFFSNIGAEA